jgi:ribosome-binding protein aMBF1 (putative translation factor)
MEKCARCGVSGDEIRLFDAIYSGRIEKICERCSIIENIPVIKRPDAIRLKESERGIGVYDRMKRLSGVKEQKKEESFFIEDKLKQLEAMPELELPEKNNLNLIEHFHWEIMKNRRRKGLSPERLAENLGESSIAITMLEKGKIPENAENLIKKLEQFFQIRLRRIDKRMDSDLQEKSRAKPVLLDVEGRELKRIPEREQDIKKQKIEVDENEGREILDLTGINREKAEFNIKKANLSQVRIADLKDLHRKKIEVTKQEKEEEKMRIAEKQKLVEAKKEELRLIREKESKELDKRLGGTELLKKDEEIPDFD